MLGGHILAHLEYLDNTAAMEPATPRANTAPMEKPNASQTRKTVPKMVATILLFSLSWPIFLACTCDAVSRTFEPYTRKPTSSTRELAIAGIFFAYWVGLKKQKNSSLNGLNSCWQLTWSTA